MYLLGPRLRTKTLKRTNEASEWKGFWVLHCLKLIYYPLPVSIQKTLDSHGVSSTRTRSAVDSSVESQKKQSPPSLKLSSPEFSQGHSLFYSIEGNDPLWTCRDYTIFFQWLLNPWQISRSGPIMLLRRYLFFYFPQPPASSSPWQKLKCCILMLLRRTLCFSSSSHSPTSGMYIPISLQCNPIHREFPELRS